MKFIGSDKSFLVKSLDKVIIARTLLLYNYRILNLVKNKTIIDPIQLCLKAIVNKIKKILQ